MSNKNEEIIKRSIITSKILKEIISSTTDEVPTDEVLSLLTVSDINKALDEFNSKMMASISVDSPDVTIDLSTSGSSIVLPQSPFDYLSGDDGAQPGDFMAQRDEELGDHEVEDSDREDIEAEDDQVDEEVEDGDEVEDDDEEEEQADDVEEEDDDLYETGLDEMDRSRLCPEEIDRLPTYINSAPSSSVGGDEASTMCQICCESYAKGDELRVLPCFHKFHSSCIDPWLLSSNSCPVCRIKVDLSEVAKF